MLKRNKYIYCLCTKLPSEIAFNGASLQMYKQKFISII